jgi:2-aminoadipate transaminase
MFLWAEVKDVDATDTLLPGAVEHGVAFVPGGAFSETATNRIRLSFSVLAPSDFDEAARRLKAALDAHR